MGLALVHFQRYWLLRTFSYKCAFYKTMLIEVSFNKSYFFSAFYTIPGDTKKICNSDQDCQKYNEKCHPLAYGHYWIWTMLGFPGVCGPKYCQKVGYHCQPIGQLFYGQLNPKTCQNGLCVYSSHFEYWNMYLLMSPKVCSNKVCIWESSKIPKILKELSNLIYVYVVAKLQGWIKF